MQLLVVFLNRLDLLEKVVSLLAEIGVTEATILEGQAMGYFLAHEVPIFAGLRQLVGEKREPNRTILALLEGEKALDELERLLRQEGIDFTRPDVGVLMSVPLARVIGPGEAD
jgi:hypothetical protein